MTQSKDRNQRKGAATGPAKTKADAEGAKVGKQADVTAQPSPDSPKRQGDKYEGAVREASKR
jgi:hypothetical protein